MNKGEVKCKCGEVATEKLFINETEIKNVCPDCLLEEAQHFCPYCGKPVSDTFIMDSGYCPNCGEKNIRE